MKIKELYKHFLLSKGVCTDTRQEVSDKIFFALSGDNFNGNSFAEKAIEKGALLCIVDDPVYKINSLCILVDSVLSTLQQLATYHRKQSNATILAITGSNGKTTTKELISIVLEKHTHIISTVGNLNNHIGVPLTLLRIKPETEIAVVEMGANHIGEIDKLCEIARPDFGIITNIGKAHLHGFGSYEGVIIAKNELYRYIKKHNGHVIVNINDELLENLSREISRFSYGKNNADVEGEIVVSHPTLQIKWGFNNNIYHCHTQLYGNYNFNNVMAAIATGISFGVKTDVINEAIENYISDNNRSQTLKTSKNNIILDAYNANPYSMKEAINSFFMCRFGNPMLLIGDMFELGNYSDSEHQIIVDLIRKRGFKNVYLIGNDFAKTINHSFTVCKNTDEALDLLSKLKPQNFDILIKGSRGMKLERLLTIL